jgi:hypothetical protein
MKMKYHDYHLSGYSVDCESSIITLRLSWPYDKETPNEQIIFTGVSGYIFRDAIGSIICDIREVDLGEFIRSNKEELSERNKIGCPKYWRPSIEETLQNLQGKHAWLITSSIGFEGHVIAGEIHQPEQIK